MKKVLLAVGHRQLEEYLKLQLDKEFSFVGATVYKEGIMKAIEQKVPDIIIIRETLDGTENIMSVVYKIRSNYPDIRIVFLAGNRKVGDELLATLVNYGVYDILNGANISAQKVISLVRTANSYNDVKQFQPVPLLDEERNKILFEAPEVEIIKEVVFRDTETIEDRELVESKTDEKSINRVKLLQVSKDKESENVSQVFTDINNNIVNEKIITFIGGKNGVGTTTLAINTAFAIANKKNKVIFIEFNDKYPAVSYWYELGFISQGIETCIENITDKNYADINKSIIRSVDLKKQKTNMQKNYKKFPNTLDFMFFSKEHLFNYKKQVKMENFKELFLYFIYQLGYDFVIIDVPSDTENKATQNALIFSNKVFSVVTQDISSIGYYLSNINNLRKMGINIDLKNNLILNKYIRSDFTQKDIKEWVEVDKMLVVFDFSKDFIDANFEGIPAIIKNQNVELLSNINNIINIITNK